MPYQPSTDRDLARAGAKQRTAALPLLVVGAAMLLAGGILLLLSGRESNMLLYVGLALVALATPPATMGAGLLISGLVSRRASRQRPFSAPISSMTP